MNKTRAALHPMRILGVFAHPDDESFCAGGTLARYVADGAEVMVVSATRGEAGQIRSFRPDVVITFGPDDGYGHPDHIAISAATTAACVRTGMKPCPFLSSRKIDGSW